MNTALDQFRMKKALIVEDHPDLLDALARQLNLVAILKSKFLSF